MKRTRRCKNCGERFLPTYSSVRETHCQKSECFQEFLKAEMLKQAKKRKAKYYRESKTLQDHIQDTQQVFNRYIRERDKGHKCISCQKPPKKKNAGHYHNANNHWFVRFNEDNCHLQCEACNNSLSGNLINYRKHLLTKIGSERLSELDSIANKVANYTIPEVLEIKEYYKEKLKMLKTLNND